MFILILFAISFSLHQFLTREYWPTRVFPLVFFMFFIIVFIVFIKDALTKRKKVAGVGKLCTKQLEF